jgi:CRISPR-associated protein Cas5d
MRPNPQIIEVWGDLACFTRPELKVERFSYPVITPSAARAIYEAIYWKPKFRWQVTRVELLSPPRYIALRRNEVKEKAPSERTIQQWMEGKSDPEPIWADDSGSNDRGRTQRQTMALKQVRYRLSAEIRPWLEALPELPSMEAQFRRRAAKGQCVYQPYLGCREFPAFYRLIADEPLDGAIPLDMDLGWMLYDVFDVARPGTSSDAPAISLFRASVKRGVLSIPDYSSADVRKPGERSAHA